jgi:hypothetical protein
MAFVIEKNAHRTWSGTKDTEGHKEYKVKFRLRGDTTDGPANAMNCPGLFLPGAPYLIDNDSDPNAYCTPDMTADPETPEDQGPGKYFDVVQTFSTKPLKKCQDDEVENPLLRPMQVSGGSTNHKEEATHDRHGLPILTSSHEVIRGPQVEIDKGRHKITVIQNVAALQLGLCDSMQDTVNVAMLWGLPPRCVKLTSWSWEKKYYGECLTYYTRRFEFDTNADTFDRDILDEGTKVLSGHWSETGRWVDDDIDGQPPDPDNPSHFIRFTDRNGNLCRVLLNGRGRPAEVVAGTESLYLSIVGSNQGNPITDNTKWRRLNNEVPEDWSSTTQYIAGDLVLFELGTGTLPTGGGFEVYFCLSDNIADPPNISGNWLNLPDGANDAGSYADPATYDLGDYVSVADVETVAGSHHIEFYHESDFLLLGIPTVL